MRSKKQLKSSKMLLCMLLASILMCCIVPMGFSVFAEEETLETVTYTNSISGMLWLDMFEDDSNGIYSGDGIRQDEEPALSGYTVNLYKAEDRDNAVAVTQTDADGKYEFTNLEPGIFAVGVDGTMDGTEYLLPINRTADNKFAMEYGARADNYLYAYTDPIKIAEDSVAAGIDAGMCILPEVETMDDYPFWLSSENNSFGWGQESLSSIAWCINSASEWALDTEFEITVRTNYTTTIDWDNLSINRGGVSIKIISADTSNPCTISAGSFPRRALIDFNSKGCTLTLQNIIIDGSGLTGNTQVGVDLQDGTLAMESGSKIQNFNNLANKCFGGGALLNCTFTMKTGSEITNNAATGSGGGISLTNSTLKMSGGTISGNTAGYGGGVQLNSSTLEMSGGTISGNTANAGGGVNAITSDQYPSRQSAIILSGSAASTIISGNTATVHSGGGIQIENGALVMSGGLIGSTTASGGNTTHSGGGGVQLMDSEFTMTGGTIAGNWAVDGGGVNLWRKDIWDESGSSSTFSMSGNAAISGNTATASGGGVFVGNTCTFLMNGGTIGGADAGNKANNSGGGVYVYYEVAGGTGFSMTGGIISGNVVTGTLVGVGNDTAVYGHGGGIAFYIQNKAFWNDTYPLDITFTGGEISNNTAIIGGGIGFFNNSEWEKKVGFTVGNIKITGNTAKTLGSLGGIGGGVGTDTPYSGDGITLTINGATIEGNTAENSGAPYYMGGNGGGVYCDPGTTFVMYSGTISGNTALGSGGGVYFHQENPEWGSSDTDTFTMTGGEIRNNTAYEGGGILLFAYRPATVSNGVITGNTAANAGGGIAFKDGSGKLTIDNTTISNNKTYSDGNWGLNHGGGIYVVAPAELDIKNTTFTSNYAENGGGGIFTTSVYAENVPGYYDNLYIDATVVFRDNAALNKYEPPTAKTIADFLSTVENATDTNTQTNYLHALNHYDINRTQYKIVITFCDKKGISFDPPYPMTKYIRNGDPFTFSDIVAIPAGYALMSWKAEDIADAKVTNNTAVPRTDTTVALDYVFADTDIFLYHQIVFEFYKVDENKDSMAGVEFALYEWAGTGSAPDLVTESTVGTEAWVLVGTFVSGEDGLVSLPAVAGTYQLVETETHEGYQLPQGQWQYTAYPTGTISDPQLKGDPSPAFYYTESTDGDKVYYLLNYRNTDIPLLGGSGTLLFTIAGVVLIGTAVLLAVWSFKKRRK